MRKWQRYAITTGLAAASVVLAIVSVYQGFVAIQAQSTQTHHMVFLAYANGEPANDVFVVFPSGEQVRPNLDGLIFVPSELVGSVVSIRDQETRRELGQFVISKSTHETKRIEISRS